MSDRPSWGDYFLGLAAHVATRATCPRLHVGTVLTRDGVVKACGYNGSTAGATHCSDEGCLVVDGHCARTLHSEANAVAQAARDGVRLAGTTAWVSHRPCWPCVKLLANSGIMVVYYGQHYGDPYPLKEPIPVVRYVDESS